MDRSKVIVDHLTKEQVDRSNLSKFQQFKIEKEYMTSAYKNYLAHQLFYTVSMLTRTIYQSVLYEYAEAIPPEKWAILDLMDEVVSDSEERFETGQESISQEEEKESSNGHTDTDSDSSSDPWQRIGAETKEGGPKDPAIQFPGIDIKIDLPPSIFTPYDHTKTDLAQEAKANADRARAEADRQHEQARQAQEAKQAAMDAAKAAKEDVERKAEALDKLVEKTTEHKADLVDPAKDKALYMEETGGRIALKDSFIVAKHNENAKAIVGAQKEAIEQFKEDLKNGVPRDEALERAQEKLETGVRDYEELTITTEEYIYSIVSKEDTIEETIKALEEYAEAKEKEAEAAKEQSEALTQAGIESAKEEMAEERAQEAERIAEQAEKEAQESSPSDDTTTNTTTTTDTETIEDEPTTCSSDSLPCADCGSDSLPCADCSSDCTSDCSSDCPSDCGTDCASDVEECGGCDCDDCGSLGVD